jgi:hypothetical protein
MMKNDEGFFRCDSSSVRDLPSLRVLHVPHFLQDKHQKRFGQKLDERNCGRRSRESQ